MTQEEWAMLRAAAHDPPLQTAFRAGADLHSFVPGLYRPSPVPSIPPSPFFSSHHVVPIDLQNLAQHGKESAAQYGLEDGEELLSLFGLNSNPEPSWMLDRPPPLTLPSFSSCPSPAPSSSCSPPSSGASDEVSTPPTSDNFATSILPKTLTAFSIQTRDPCDKQPIQDHVTDPQSTAPSRLPDVTGRFNPHEKKAPPHGSAIALPQTLSANLFPSQSDGAGAEVDDDGILNNRSLGGEEQESVMLGVVNKRKVVAAMKSTASTIVQFRQKAWTNEGGNDNRNPAETRSQSIKLTSKKRPKLGKKSKSRNPLSITKSTTPTTALYVNPTAFIKQEDDMTGGTVGLKRPRPKIRSFPSGDGVIPTAIIENEDDMTGGTDRMKGPRPRMRSLPSSGGIISLWATRVNSF